MTSKSASVTPFNVDLPEDFCYTNLVKQFGANLITPDLIERFEKVTKLKPHYLMTRGIFFSHRDLDLILNDYEAGKEIFLYTGRGPSSESLHIGHMISLMFTAYLQKAFNAIVVIQMSNDEKFYFKKELTSFETINRY